MAFKFVLKLEELEGADPDQVAMEGVPKQKVHKKLTPVAAADNLVHIMRFAAHTLVDEYPKDKSLVLYAKDKGSEIEMDRWKCSRPIAPTAKKDKTERGGDE